MSLHITIKITIKLGENMCQQNMSFTLVTKISIITNKEKLCL